MNSLLRFNALQLARDFSSSAFSFAHGLAGSPEKDARAAVFRLDPGMGLNQPLHAPHVGEAYSISVTVAVISDAWAWQAPVHRANRWLQRRGIVPSPVGSYPIADAHKSFAYRASARLARAAGRFAGPNGELRSEPH